MAPPSTSRHGPNLTSLPVSDRKAPTSTYHSRNATVPEPSKAERDPVADAPSSTEVSEPSDATTAPPAFQVAPSTNPTFPPARPAIHASNHKGSGAGRTGGGGACSAGPKRRAIVT